MNSEQHLSTQLAWSETNATISELVEDGATGLVVALPSMGKSRGAVEYLRENDEQGVIFVARHERMDEIEEWASEGTPMSFARLPSFHRDCPTVSQAETDSETDSEHKEMREWALACHQRGMSGGMIHELAHSEFGRGLPCEARGNCPYQEMRQEDWSQYDLLVGHYTHALRRFNNDEENHFRDRVIFIDEFPDVVVKKYDRSEVNNAISAYIRQYPDFPVRNLNRFESEIQDERVREKARKHVLDNSWRGNAQKAGLSSGYRLAPTFILAYLNRKELPNGLDLARTPGEKTVVWDSKGSLQVLTRPDFAEAKAVIGLDGTPSVARWTAVLGETLTVRWVLGDRWNEYLSEVLNIEVVQTTDNVKAYSATTGGKVTPAADLTYLQHISDVEGRPPFLIASKTALNRIDIKARQAEKRLSDFVSGSRHYGDIKGTNQLGDVSLGVVIGSEHYGDDYVQVWGAFLGHSIERVCSADGYKTGGNSLSYGDVGDDILRSMREGEVLQAVLRFGRDGQGARVYVQTSALPEWLDHETRLVETVVFDRGRQTGLREVVDTLHSLPDWETRRVTVREIAERLRETDTTVAEESRTTTEARVRYNLDKLVRAGLLQSSKDVGPNGAVTRFYCNRGLNQAGPFGYAGFSADIGRAEI